MARMHPKPKYRPPVREINYVPVARRHIRDLSLEASAFRCCVPGCANQGCYGFGVKLLADRLGTWGRLTHREEARQASFC